MNSNDLVLAKKAQNMENRLIMDYSNAVITVENKDLINEIVSVLNEKISILNNLRNYTSAEKENCTEIPPCSEEIRAVIKKFNP